MYSRRLRLPLIVVVPLVSAVLFISQQVNTAVVAADPANPFHMAVYDSGRPFARSSAGDAYTDNEGPFELYSGPIGRGWPYSRRYGSDDIGSANAILVGRDRGADAGGENGNGNRNDNDENSSDDDNEAERNRLDHFAKRSSRIHVYRRDCVHRNGRCDTRPNDCCFNTSCRCNLWGNNCRCQRIGLFQKWG